MADIPPIETPPTLTAYEFGLRATFFFIPIFVPLFVWAFCGSDDPIPNYVLCGWGVNLVLGLGVWLGVKSPMLKGIAKATVLGCITIFLAAVLFFAFIFWVGFGLGD